MKEVRRLSVDEAANIVRNEKDDEAKMQALAKTTISILGTEFVVEILTKEHGGYTLLLAPTKVDNAPERSLQEIIDKINGYFDNEAKVDTSELEALVTEGGLSNFREVMIHLTMAFLYINKDIQKEKEVEYAFQFKVTNLDKLIPKEISKYITTKNVQLSIWNTTKKKVIDAMELIKHEDYLKE